MIPDNFKALFQQIFHTTAMRLSLRYAFYSMVLMGGGLAAIYWSTSRYVDAQTTVSLEQKLASLKSLYETQGLEKMRASINTPALFNLENPRYILLASSSGKKLAGNLFAWPEGITPDEKVRNIWLDDYFIAGITDENEDDNEEVPDGYWPTVATVLPQGERLLITQSIRQSEDLQEFTLSMINTILLVVFGLTLLLGWQLGRKILSRIERINNTSRLISEGEMSQRIPLSDNADEFDELASHLNHMLSRIEQLLKGMREVTDNVAHDLRSPLSRLRNRLEVTLLENRNKTEYQQVIQQSVDDLESVIRTFNALLEISQAEAGSYRGDWTKLDLSELVIDITDLYNAEGDNQERPFLTSVEPHLKVYGNRHLLSQMISNLLENALKYAPSDSPIECHLLIINDMIVLSVCDSGPGISEYEKERVLERFVRLDKARTTDGNGLGLSLVKAVARLHGATLKLEDNDPGLCVKVAFPNS